MQLIEESRKYNGRKNEIQHQAAENNSGMPAGIWRYILYHRSIYGAPSWKRDPDREDNGIQRTGAAAEGGSGAEGSVCGGSACPVSFYT